MERTEGKFEMGVSYPLKLTAVFVASVIVCPVSNRTTPSHLSLTPRDQLCDRPTGHVVRSLHGLHSTPFHSIPFRGGVAVTDVSLWCCLRDAGVEQVQPREQRSRRFHGFPDLRSTVHRDSRPDTKRSTSVRT